jgi:hypothetical protein
MISYQPLSKLLHNNGIGTKRERQSEPYRVGNISAEQRFVLILWYNSPRYCMKIRDATNKKPGSA